MNCCRWYPEFKKWLGGGVPEVPPVADPDKVNIVSLIARTVVRMSTHCTRGRENGNVNDIAS